MKKFTIEVSHASTAQLSTIALELKIMSNGWVKHGPRITINGKPSGGAKPNDGGAKPQAPSRKRQALKKTQLCDKEKSRKI